MRGNSHVRCGTGEKQEIVSNVYLSSFEKGFDIVSEEKIEYLCSKLHIERLQLPQLLQMEKQLAANQLSKLLFIENMIDLGNVKRGLQLLRQLNVDVPHLQATVEYLKGRALINKNHSTTAQSHFLKAIKLSNQQSLVITNIGAACYNQLAKIAYYENDFELALDLTDKGIGIFADDGDRQQLIYSLLVNKAIYLEKLDLLDRASTILQELWSKITEIRHVEVIINMYDVQATIYKKFKLFKKAISYAQEGFEIAHINKNSHRSVELLTNLGSTYLETQQYDQAETCFSTALSLKSKVKPKYLFLPIYSRLGQIYIELNKFDQAEKILETAIRDKTNQKNILRYTEALITLGDCFFKQKEYIKATQPYLKARNLASKHGLITQEHRILRNLCLCWRETNQQKYQEGLHRFFELDVQICKGGDNLLNEANK
ncbi:Tetratricopeptide repeat-containing protein [Seinonella peptonophila]|uniref:Tetratricopeptide repeat-containing protein n=1 Tax=Seinonella peptonophila TaxID=112248 RepID=A0A1M4SZK1_9BACL|nr:tetratricopeptide repeat protein [Seinonella peptonophila]SHE37658.1 Tetratricopeptide repeat-containing protein [Seinonella peptonophila]